jgi:DNA-binding Lrp family transcriptional regulator
LSVASSHRSLFRSDPDDRARQARPWPTAPDSGTRRRIPQVSECHRITGEDCFYLKVYLRAIDELSSLLDRFLAHGETTTSIVNASPIPRRDPPSNDD